ncbi:MAG TPA: PA2779 family protein [Acidobacteriaceae bacterium]|nr:PA2779 family protein [Acidobacteriaceae bacterium]
MKLLPGSKLSCASLLLISVAVAAPNAVVAQSHVVSPGDIQNDVSNTSAARRQNRNQVEKFLSSQEAQRAMKSAKLDPQQVTNAVSQLNDAELASLAARSAKAQKDFAAGTIDNHDLLLILVGLAALILIIVAVH